MFPESLERFVNLISKLPSIGPRQATRLGFYLLRQGKSSLSELAQAIAGLKNIETCAQCFFPYETSNGENLCDICRNNSRNKKLIAIVEKETDLLSLEKAKKFDGRYLVLGEIAKDGILTIEQKLRLSSLEKRIEKDFKKAEEIIIALNPTTVGDIEANLIIQELKPFTEKITRLGRGLPTGGEIEFADEDTLGGALENRR